MANHQLYSDHLKTELHLLRSHPEFQNLLAELAAGPATQK
jgi:hypothetical protein